MSEKFNDELINKNLERIAGTHIFLSIFSENAIKDPIWMLQLGAAIILDKPIHLIVFPGMKIPENLKRASSAIHFATQEEANGETSLSGLVDRIVKEFDH